MPQNKVSYLYIARDKYTRVAEKVARVTGKVRRKFVGLNKTMLRVRAGFKGIVRGMSSGFARLAAAAAGFFGARAIVQAGTRFQDAMADLSAITGATGEDLDNLRKKTLAMAKASVTAQGEVATAIKLVASAKPDLLKNLDALTATTEQVLLLKNAAGIELASAANITAQALNIFGVAASKANDFVNVLAAGAKLGSSEIAETGEAMLLAGPAARAAGLDFVQLNAAIQTVAKGGIKGARAGTALNSILGRLRRQGFDFQKLGLEGTFEKVKEKLDRVKNSTKRAQLEAKIFGEEHAKVGLAILNNTRLLGQYERTLKGTNVASEQAAIRMATFSTKMRSLSIAISDKLIRVFNKLEPILTKQIEIIGLWFESLNERDIESFTNFLKGMAAVLATVAHVAGWVATAFKSIGTFIGEDIAQTIELFSKIKSLPFIRDIFGSEEPAGKPGIVGTNGRTQTDVNINLRAPQGAVESVKAKRSAPGMNLGLNMVTMP